MLMIKIKVRCKFMNFICKKHLIKFFYLFLLFSLFSMLFTSVLFAKDVYFVTSIRTVANPYQAAVAKGSEMFVKSLGLEDKWILQQCDGDSAKQLRDIRAVIAKYGSDLVFYVDPNNAPDAVPIAKTLEEAGVYFVSFWNKPDDVAPWDFNHWISHIAYDDVQSGYDIAVELFKTFNFKGNIVALWGFLANTPNVNRTKGLEKALQEYPNVKLLASQAADGNRTKAYEITMDFISKYGEEIDGIWSYNDDQAMGAIEALRAKGLEGKIPVVGIDAIPEMINAISAGEATATVSSDPYWGGGMALSTALAAYQGKIDVKSLPKDSRCYNGKTILITPDNVEWYLKNYIDGFPEYDWEDYWGRVVSPLPVK
jgi:ribose transport system substrate-binding protein